MKVAVIGTGYVGLVTGVLLSDFGNYVICVDNNIDKINMLNNNHSPIYEPGLSEIINKCKKRKRLQFTTNIKRAVEESEVIFIAVGTPSDENGRIDLSYVTNVTREIGKYINEYKVIVNKSTVPVGTNRKSREIIQREIDLRKQKIEFDIVSNPEFLREGCAVYDFRHPDRIIIGSDSKKAVEIMREVYRVLYINHAPFIECDPATAEMIKYANNAFLATKITFINEIANLCENVGANVQKVAEAMGKDGRISQKFLHAGPGFGGSCFPKDTRALIEIANEHNEQVRIIKAVVEANEAQKYRMVDKIKKNLGDLFGREIAVLGITFKPETDDMREAPSIIIIQELVRLGALIKIYDPEGEREGKIYFKDILDKITFSSDEYNAVEGVDGLVILTEWNLFRNLDLSRIKKIMKGCHFFDFRNIYDKATVEEIGFKYTGVGV